MDALKYIPSVDAPLLTEKGEARLQKTDIFRKLMWFAFKDENNWYALNVDRVNEILELNRQGKKPASLERNEVEVRLPLATLNSDLESLDKKFKDRGRNKSRNQNQNRGRRDNRGPRNPNNPNRPKPSDPNKPNNPNSSKG